MAANNLDTAAQLRFLATVKRQSAPPRCNPFAIVIQVLAMGMIFIGLTMTIIAHWPGVTSIGENPLKIAGPILLGVGFAAFIFGIILVSILNKRERKRWETTVARMTASRPTLDPSLQHPGENKPIVIQQPQAGPLPVKSGAPAPRSMTSQPSDWSHDDSADLNDSDVPDAIRVKKSRTSRQHTKTTTTTTTVTTQQEKVAVRSTKPPAPPPAAAAEEEIEMPQESHSLLGRRDDAAAGTATPESKRLHVHVKALPGATVRIQQGSSRPAVAPKPAFAAHNQSTTSAETDI